MNKLELYSYFRSSASYRVRIALNLKKLAYEYKPVHLVNNGGEQHSPQYTTLNPMHEVPTLVHNGHCITQSMAIIEYLDEVFTEPKLIFGDSLQKAKIRMFCENINSGIHPIQNLKVLQAIEANFNATAQQKESWAAHWIHLGFVALEEILTQTSKRYCFADKLTAADVYLIPQVFNAYRFKVDLSPFPNIEKVYNHCLELDSFISAQPSLQPDAF